MPATQTTYNTSLTPGVPGLVANMETANSISRLVEDVAGIGFGVAVFQGTGDLGITAAPGTMFRGVTVQDKTLLASQGQPVDVYPQKATAAVHEKGTIWVQASAAVAAGTPAYVTPAGAWTTATAGNTAIPGGFFDSSTTGAGLAKLHIR